MSPWVLIGSLVVMLAPDPSNAPPATAADAVTLRDGQVTLGQLVDPAPRGKVVLLVRRKWAEENVPDWAKKWEAAEAAWVPRARRERRERLIAWRRERAAGPTKRGDPITAWLDREIDRLSDGADVPPCPLMAVQIGRGDVRSTVRRPRETARMLRQGWLAGFAQVETMPLDVLKQALEGRGFALNGADAAAVDSLLPVMPEPEARWQARRAATEIANETGLRFIRYQGLVLPEDAPAAPAGATALVGTLKALLDDKPPEDPMAATFRAVAARGRAGLVVTRLELAPDFETVVVESAFWVRDGRDHWEQAGSRTATVHPNSLGPGAGNDLAEDPQVKAAFALVESLGLGQVAGELRQRSLSVGAASRKALGLARSALDQDLDALALTIAAGPEPGPRPDARP